MFIRRTGRSPGFEERETPRIPLDQVAEGYRAMDERRAIKALLIPAVT